MATRVAPARAAVPSKRKRADELGQVVLTEAEFAALAKIAREYARIRGEDVIGAILLTSGNMFLRDEENVSLTHKVNGADLDWALEGWETQFK
jgi:hypothetical protein